AICRHFGTCGGCQMQHIDHADQVALKQRRLLEALQAEQVVPQQVLEPQWGEGLHYRTRARLGVRVVDGEVLIGFRESFSGRVMRMTYCRTLIEAFADLLEPLRQLIGGLSSPTAIPQVELAAGDDSQAIVLRHLVPLTPEDDTLLENFSNRHGLALFRQASRRDLIAPPGAGARLLSYANPDLDLRFEFLPWEFTQVNLAMNRRLVAAAIRGLAPGQGSPVVDLFCGIGNFSLALARSGARVIGYESDASAVARAQNNAQLNRLDTRCEFVLSDLYDRDCDRLAETEYMLLDPPRSGAGPNLPKWIGGDHLRRVAYVSCEPGTFAADAKVLAERGFVLEQTGIFDMFPQTAHVETLGVFSRAW
ncbi:MAG: methyltransferase domain-containing protein, partial [Pseudomonadales bacterium]|nr:methyltransferase domain-containing protein [Pseudomonadales bacterium]